MLAEGLRLKVADVLADVFGEKVLLEILGLGLWNALNAMLRVAIKANCAQVRNRTTERQKVSVQQ